MPRPQLIPNRDKVNEIGRFYNAMGTMIRYELIKIDAGNYKELETISVRKNVNKIIKKMNRFAIKWSRRATLQTYKEQMAKTKVSLDVLGFMRDEFFDEKTHFHTVDKSIEKTTTDLLKANQSIKVNVNTYLYLIQKSSNDIAQIQAFDMRDEEVIANLLDDAIRGGASRSKLESILRVHFKRELYEKKFININGRNYDMIKYARNIARTRLRIVQSETVKNMMAQFDADLIEISDHGTEFDDICLEFEGKIFSISGKTPGYDVLDMWPPFHPQCEHSASPTSEVAIEFRGTQ